MAQWVGLVGNYYSRGSTSLGTLSLLIVYLIPLPTVCLSWKFPQVLISSPVSCYSPSLTVILMMVEMKKGRSRWRVCALPSTRSTPATSNPERAPGSLYSCFGKSKEEVKDSFPFFTMGLEREGGLVHFKTKFYSKVSWMHTQKCVHLHSSVICNCEKVGNAPMSINWCMGKWKETYAGSGIVTQG